MKKILVPTDFSDYAKFALEVAYRIAQRSGSEIVLMHVIEDSTSTSVHYTGDLDISNNEEKLFMVRMIQKTKKDLSALADEYPGVPIKQQIRIGNPYHNIKDHIVEEKVDLVVMGTAGVSGLEELLIGSNTEKVVRHSVCPVLSVHLSAGDFSFKNIVYATDGNNDSEACINVLKKFQEMYDSKLHIVRINTPNNFERDADSYEELQKFADKCGLSNYELMVYNDVSEEEGIIYYAESINADMIAMATHGRSGLAHLLSGSIAEDVVNHTKRPVLTYVKKD